jgi:hypothetical protein
MKFADIFHRIEIAATAAYLRDDPEWVECPSASCKFGALMVGGHIFTCQVCQYRYCFGCQVPMHEEETCTVYAERVRAKETAEALSEKEVEKTSKPCPKCKSRLDKFAGCDHVTCMSSLC